MLNFASLLLVALYRRLRAEGTVSQAFLVTERCIEAIENSRRLAIGAILLDLGVNPGKRIAHIMVFDLIAKSVLYEAPGHVQILNSYFLVYELLCRLLLSKRRIS